MINLDFFSKIRFNRCEIVLSESESYFLYSKFRDSIILRENKVYYFSKDNIKKILLEFYNSSSTRYFSKNDLDYITNYYFEMINEEIGRGRASEISPQINARRVIYKHTGIDTDDAASTIRGSATGTEHAKDSVAFINRGETESDVEVDDPDAAHVFLKNVEANVISKI